MPRYFIHFLAPARELLDPEGVELPDAQAARAHARARARTALRGIEQAKAWTEWRVEVRSEDGDVVLTLPLPDVIAGPP